VHACHPRWTGSANKVDWYPDWPGKKKWDSIWKITWSIKGVVQMVVHLPIKCEALSSSSSTTKKVKLLKSMHMHHNIIDFTYWPTGGISKTSQLNNFRLHMQIIRSSTYFLWFPHDISWGLVGFLWISMFFTYCHPQISQDTSLYLRISLQLITERSTASLTLYLLVMANLCGSFRDGNCWRHFS
jgi:hypothetical protein